MRPVFLPVYGQYGKTEASMCQGGEDAGSKSHGGAACLVEGYNSTLYTAPHYGFHHALPEHLGTSKTEEPCWQKFSRGP